MYTVSVHTAIYGALDAPTWRVNQIVKKQTIALERIKKTLVRYI